MSSIRPQRAPFRLADLGVYGFDRHETTILASLVTEGPLLLVGRSGTGKTFLLNTLSEALGPALAALYGVETRRLQRRPQLDVANCDIKLGRCSETTASVHG